MRKQALLQSNPSKLLLASFLGSIAFEYAIWILYLQHYGISLQEILLLEVLINIAMIVWEFPSGIFADTIGKVKAVSLGRCLIAIHYVLLALAPSSFLMQIIGFLSYGFGFAMLTGTEEAVLATRLEQLKVIESHKFYAGLEFVGQLALLLGIVIGGVVGISSAWILFLIGAGLQLLAIPFYGTDTKSKINDHADSKTTPNNPIEMLFILWPHIQRWRSFVPIALVNAALLLYLIFYPVTLKTFGFEGGHIGIFMAILILCQLIGNSLAFRTSKLLKKKYALPSMFILIGILILGTLNSVFILNFILSSSIFVLWGVVRPITIQLIVEMVPDSIRASMGSFVSFITSISLAILSGGLSLVINSGNTPQSIIAVLSGILCFIAVPLAFAGSKSHKYGENSFLHKETTKL